ncbi:M23 family metallopeptidase [Aurantiacibacter rhizosphaerae]|uniref:Peptidoglycan DD-metalloendopeptidase family protein n=1 Tax=Aurantiacibacter rhizosphaerae TaxID=2691582 RepID=A0A844XE90_9SPHN|nr:M23 family metallopeptidase [Aurantiacibacter rhizosphaerae]MWV28160.1 peptidoglycan DD-metalloendopeptidase family protein [Aurantiacibacter rhizosphaerae]
MASSFAEKAQVAAVTATLVSAGWIVAGAFLLDRAETAQIEQEIATKQATRQASRENADPQTAPGADDDGEAMPVPQQNRETVTMPPQTETAKLVIPVLNTAATDLTDSFADERGGGTRLHQGIDIMADAGSSVVAAAPGTIERLFRSDAGGNTIYVRSDDRKTIYYYAHLQDYAQGLNEGQQVRRGQRLGTVGSSGNADPSAPHLHFEVMRTTPTAEWWEPANSVNPYPLLVQQQQQQQ